MSYGNPKTADHLAPGTVVAGRYEIIDVVGEGGFATVYRARQTEIHREVALKLLNPAADLRTQQAFQERFRREARTAASIDHPNVVTIYDFGIADEIGRPFMAMELLQGHDLEVELQDNGPMDAARAVGLFANVLEALGDAHKLGIIHKDLKPSNLFLTQPGTRREMLKILDFGIARLADVQAGKGKLTGTGQILGTPQYLAPEYIQHQTATPALDVYQMGLILVETLTGAPVVDYDNPYQCLMVHGSGKLEVPRSLVSGPLGPVLLQALELDHTARYQNASEFQRALGAIDPATIGVVPPGEVKHRLSEVSGSMRSNADLGSADTGAFAQRDSGSLQQGERVMADGTVAKAAAAATSGSSSGSLSAPGAAISGDYGEPRARAGVNIGALIGVAGLLLVAVLVGAAVAVWLGMDYSNQVQEGAGPAVVAAVPSEPAAMEPTPPEPPRAEEVAPTPVPVNVSITSPPGVAIYRGDTLLGTGTAVLEFASKDAAPVDVHLGSAPGATPEWVDKAVSVGPQKASIVLEPSAPPPEEEAVRAKRPKREKREAPVVVVPKVEPKKPVEAPKKRPSMGFVE